VHLFAEGWSLGAPGPSLFRLAAHRRSNKIDDASLLWHCRGPRTGINIRINGAERFSPLSVCFSLFFSMSCPLCRLWFAGKNVSLIWKLKLEGARERKTYVCLIKRRKFLEPLCNLHRFQIRGSGQLTCQSLELWLNAKLLGPSYLAIRLQPLRTSVLGMLHICIGIPVFIKWLRAAHKPVDTYMHA